MFTDKFVIANGLRLHYLDYGGADDLPWIVCIHGLSSNAHHFDALAPHLTPKYHVISIDVRGRGDSEFGPPTEYLPQFYASDLVLMLDAIGIERANLIGTSMGGIISMMFAGGWPERALRVVLNDIGPDIDTAGATRIANYVGEAPERFENLDEVVQYYRNNYQAMAAMPESTLRDLVQWSVKPAAGGGLTWKMDPNVRRPLRGGTAQQRLDLWVPFARINCPMLIVRGAASDILAPATAATMCRVHNQATSIEVPNVGHAPTLTEPVSLAAIKKFFAV
jgi:pimeloyl-ACP methyl ester carboxylesterase